jgi:hypothetical protein
LTSKTKKAVSYNPIITHDVDRYYKWKNFKSIFGEFNRIFGGRSTWSYSEAWKSFQKRRKADPFSNLRQIAELDNLAGLHSVFYIMTTEEKHLLNINDYSVKEQGVKDTLKELIAMGSEIGIHPGINTYNDGDKMQEQKERLEIAIGQKVTRSRQHYLKYEYPITFEILESIGIQNDSSILVDLSLVEDKTNRTTYSMFEENGSEITQTPLVFMDTHYMQSKDDEILKTLEACIAPAKRDGGEVMILWHNNNISNNREIGLYREALDVIKG